MSLFTLDEPINKGYGTGYKFVEKRDGTYLCCDFIPNIGEVEYPLNSWVEDKNVGLDCDEVYNVGFHIMLVNALQDRCSSPNCIIKVEYEDVVASQVNEPDDLYGPVVVARRLRNIGEVDKQGYLIINEKEKI